MDAQFLTVLLQDRGLLLHDLAELFGLVLRLLGHVVQTIAGGRILYDRGSFPGMDAVAAKEALLSSVRRLSAGNVV